MADLKQTLTAVTEAIRAQQFERAVDLAEAALAGGSAHELLLNLRAWRLERAGRYDAALADLSHARRLAPRDIPTLNALGLCLANLGRHGEALEVFDAAIAVNPTFAPAHFNRGWVGEEAGELDAARRSFAEAARLNPVDPTASARLAALAARGGDWAEARRLAIQVLAVQPRQSAAVLALAAAEAAAGELAAARLRLIGLLAEAELSPIDEAQAQGQLGDVLERLDRPAEAFARFAAANAALRAHYAPRFAGPDAQTVPAMLDWLARYFRDQPADRWRFAPAAAPEESAPRAHVFLLGFPRSGTTLLERVLTASPDVAASEERETLTEATIAFMRSPATLDALAELDAGGLARHRALYWARVRQMGVEPQGRVFVDKLPLNSIKLPLIARLFPEARVLLAVRDPRDVVLSGFRQRFRINPSMFELLNLEGAAAFYDQVMGLTALYRERFDLPVLVHRYEDLVGDFETAARRVCAFVGVAFSEDMRRFERHGERRAIATPSAGQVVRGLYDGSGQWRRYAAELAPVLPRLAPWIARFGYPPD